MRTEGVSMANSYGISSIADECRQTLFMKPNFIGYAVTRVQNH